MANKLYEENSIRDIANAIREKNLTTNTYTVAEMGNAIRNIKASSIETCTLYMENDYPIHSISNNQFIYMNGIGFAINTTIDKLIFPLTVMKNSIIYIYGNDFDGTTVAADRNFIKLNDSHSTSDGFCYMVTGNVVFSPVDGAPA